MLHAYRFAKKKLATILIISGGLFLVSFLLITNEILADPNICNDIICRVQPSTEVVIDSYNESWRVINNSVDREVFIPVKTATEWAQFRLHYPPAYITLEPYIVVPWTCGDDVVFTYNGAPVTYGTISRGGLCWLDRNLGALTVPTSRTDTQGYGDAFQWGRADDGHQIRTSATTASRSATDNPGHSDFIAYSFSPYDWRNPQNDNLWQGEAGVNNPCPDAWRVPTEAELNAERLSWSRNNYTGAFESTLKWPSDGARSSSGQSYVVGTEGRVWSSNAYTTFALLLNFQAFRARSLSGGRAYGYTVRCVRD